MPNLHLLLVTGPDNIALLPEPGALLIADSRPPGIASTRHTRLQLLETTSKKVIDVALESGFCNAAHFSDCFRRHFSQSPSEVRRASLHHRAG